MKIPSFAPFVAVLGLVSLAIGQEGFTPLFNGTNLDGWQTARTSAAESLDGKTQAYEGRVKVVDGCLVYDPAVKGDRYLATVKQFSGNVVIKFEFNAGANCNNDFFLRGSKFDIVPGKKETTKIEMGSWHTMEIIVQGDQIEHKIDGQSVRTAKAAAAATPFMLRAEFGTIQIKNIGFKE